MNRSRRLAAGGFVTLLFVALVASMILPAPATAGRSSPATIPLGKSRGPGIAERLQQTLEESHANTATPGVQAAVLRDGELVWYGFNGDAVKKPKRPVSAETLFYYASFGKMVLSSFAMNLVETGIVSLDEPVETYVGNSIPGAGRVTIRMLLSHTAGYPDIYSQPEVAPLFGRRYDPNRNWSFNLLFKGLRAPHHPGERWEYSNTGYLVLAYVLSRATDDPLPEACLDFLAPAGVTAPKDESAMTMRQTPTAAEVIAHGYQFNNKPPYDTFVGADLIPTDLFGMPWGDGAFAGTALGAARFLDGLLVNGLLLEPATVEEMIAPTEQSLAENAPYGLGTEQYEAVGRTWQGHSGAYGGYSSMGYTDLASGSTVVVVANGWGKSGPLPAVPIWRDLARVYVESELDQ